VSQAERLAEAVERLIAVLARQRGAIGGEPNQLTTTQGLALAALADAGMLRQGTLAELLGTTNATASRTVDALEAAGLARRSADPADRRGTFVQATPRGRREIQRRRERLAAMVSHLLKGLRPGDQRRLIDLLSGLNDLLIGAGASAPPTREIPRQGHAGFLGSSHAPSATERRGGRSQRISGHTRGG
jgi:DNA-binding MarR family transcriptional regulator